MLPPSMTQAGYVDLQTFQKKRRRRLMIGTSGGPNTGKSEFIWSIPGPGVDICIDRGFEALLSNPNPPPERRNDWAIDVVPVRLNAGANQQEWVKYWNDFKAHVYKAAEQMPDVRAVAIDGDSDSWELQRLAEHGTLTGVYPQTRYGPVKAARRAFYARLFDSGKTIICTNKLQDEYVDLLDASGNPVMDPEKPGETKRVKSGRQIRQGFDQYEYLFQVQLMHLYKEPELKVTPAEKLRARREGREPVPVQTAPQWGIRIEKCKHHRPYEGDELWGDQCNFKGLVSHIFPDVPLSEWGF